jgi:hypothetical protein
MPINIGEEIIKIVFTIFIFLFIFLGIFSGLAGSKNRNRYGDNDEDI